MDARYPSYLVLGHTVACQVVLYPDWLGHEGFEGGTSGDRRVATDGGHPPPMPTNEFFGEGLSKDPFRLRTVPLAYYVLYRETPEVPRVFPTEDRSGY